MSAPDVNNGSRMLFLFSELRKFLRVEVGAVIVCMALSGYLIFNAPGHEVVYVILAISFMSFAGYAYNHYTDKKEDEINNKRLNFFVLDNKGYYIISACAVSGLVPALFLPSLSLSIYVITLAATFIYSFFKVKDMFPMKNVYSGFFMSTSFLIGAAARGLFTVDMIMYFLLVFIIGLTGNLIGDIRGHEGDKAAGIRTIPVMMGIKGAKRVVHLNFGFFSAVSLLSGYFLLAPIIPSLAATSFFLNRDDHLKARVSMISTFLILVPVLVVIRLVPYVFNNI